MVEFLRSQKEAKLVPEGYPVLASAGAELVQEGIEFKNAEYVFKNVTEALYVDDCCHVDEKGQTLMAGWIADLITDGEPRK